MRPELVRPKVPVGVVVVVVIATAVILLLLAQAAIGLFLSIVRTIIILGGFAAMAVVGLWLWRRGA